MQRTIVVCLLLLFSSGCGAGGKAPLFSGSSARVPAPGTKSYGTPDNSYYNSSLSAPMSGFSNSSDPGLTTAANNSSLVANNSSSNTDLNWRPIGSRIGLPVSPTASSNAWGTNNNFAPVGYLAPSQSAFPTTVSASEPRVQVIEAPGRSEPARFQPAPAATNIATLPLPQATPAPRIRMSATTPAQGFSSSNGSSPTPPAANSSLNWRTRN